MKWERVLHSVAPALMLAVSIASTSLNAQAQAADPPRPADQARSGNQIGTASPTPAGDSMDAWRLIVAQRTLPLNILVIGDSITCCIGPRDYNNVWTNVLRRRLAALGSEHGTGIIPVGNNDGLATNPQWSLHPHLGTISTVNFGPYQRQVGAFGATFRLQGNAQLTLLSPDRPAKRLVLYYASYTDSASGIQVWADTHKLSVVGAEKAYHFVAHSVSVPLDQPNGTTISFSAAATGLGDAAYVYGAEFIYEDGGVSLHNLAHGYARSEAWGGDPTTDLAYLNVISGNIQLTLLSLGVNDSINGTGTTSAQYVAHLRAVIKRLRQINPTMSIIIYDELNTGPGELQRELPQSQIRRDEQYLAETEGLSYVSPAARLGNASQENNNGLLTHDMVHPTDLGGRILGEIISSYILERFK